VYGLHRLIIEARELDQQLKPLTGFPPWKPTSANVDDTGGPFADIGLATAGFDPTLGSTLFRDGGSASLEAGGLPATGFGTVFESALLDDDGNAACDVWT